MDHQEVATILYAAFRLSHNATKWDGMEDLPPFGWLAHEEKVAWYAVGRKALQMAKQNNKTTETTQ
jgi:hypothetical protein